METLFSKQTQQLGKSYPPSPILVCCFSPITTFSSPLCLSCHAYADVPLVVAGALNNTLVIFTSDNGWTNAAYMIGPKVADKVHYPTGRSSSFPVISLSLQTHFLRPIYPSHLFDD
jgi:hypothetical protein